MIGPIERKPFYWLVFRVADDEDADWYTGRAVFTNGEFWLMLRNQDLGRLPSVRLQTRLDERRLLERFDTELGGTYFVHQGPLQEKQ
jgi:hypothetical protein